MNIDLSSYRQRFLDYVSGFRDVPDAAPLRLKVEHTFRVVEHAQRIVDSLAEDAFETAWAENADVCRAVVLAALYHDCGRFPQFRRYRTFLDAKSVNHALLSFQTIRDGDFLRGETRRVRHLVQCGVLLHNRYALSSKLAPEARFVTDAVRDSDKLDIFRVMVGYLDHALPERDAVLLHVQDEPDRWTPKIAEDVMEGRVSRYTDLKFVNDFRLLLGTWTLELRFAATRRALAESGLMESVLSGLPDAPALLPAKKKLYALLEHCREGGGERP